MSKEPSGARTMFGGFAPKFVELTDEVLFADVWERPELSQRDRSLVTVAALVALNRPEQLRFHLGRAVENGVTEELAGLAHMSVSSFHQHFKAVTSMSPLQYQKTLRLQEARRLMLSKTMDAGIASRNVGYASVSQFSREYGRYFGAPPAKDVNRLRGQVGGAVVEKGDIGDRHGNMAGTRPHHVTFLGRLAAAHRDNRRMATEQPAHPVVAVSSRWVHADEARQHGSRSRRQRGEAWSGAPSR